MTRKTAQGDVSIDELQRRMKKAQQQIAVVQRAFNNALTRMAQQTNSQRSPCAARQEERGLL